MDADRELDLVKRAQTGDRDSYGRLVDLYGGAVFAIAYSRVGNYATAQDIAQDAFLLGFEQLVKLRHPRRFGSWLKTITANLCNRWHRSQSYRDRLRDDSVAVRERLGYVQAPGTEETMDQQEIHRLLDEALRNLPVRDRESIVLYYFEGKSLDDAAKAFGISPAAMRKRLERARGRLRDELSAHVESGLVEAARGRRRMSARALAALPAGASFAKVAPAASVLPSAPLLHLTGTLSTMGGTVMGINKAAIIGAICAAAIIAGSGVYLTRGTTPPEEPPAERTELAQSVSVQQEPPDPTEPSQPQDSEPAELSLMAGTAAVTTALQGASISGTVTASDTGAPIPGAEIYVRGPERRNVFSESDGTYTCGLLPEGEYDVRANVAENVVRNWSPHRKVSLSHDEHLTGIDFTFERGATISGRITDRATNGIEGAKVVVLGRVRGTLVHPKETQSGEKGNYRLTGIGRDSVYQVRIAAKNYGGIVSDLIRVPGKGDVSGMDFTLEPGASVSGRVVDTEGRVVPNARVKLELQVDNTWHDLLPHYVPAPAYDADADGRFEIVDIGPGTYAFFVARGQSNRRSENDPITVEADERITGVDVVILAKGEGVIEGYARDADGNGIAGVSVHASSSTSAGGNAETSSSGHYRIDGLGEGMFRLYLSHKEYGQADLAGIPAGTTDADVVMMRDGSVAGVVMDAATGDPIHDFKVSSGVRGSRNFSSEAGKFLLEDVRPGRVMLWASAEGYAPEGISDIVVESGEVTEGIEFRLSQGHIVRGRTIASSDSHPVAGATIILGGIPPLKSVEAIAFRAITAADGSFVLKGLAAGEHAIGVRHPDFAPTTVTVEVPEDGETQLTIALTMGGTVAGYVSEEGVAIVGAEVNVMRDERSEGEDVTTDADGYYEAKKLQPGMYDVRVTVGSAGEVRPAQRTQAARLEVYEGLVTEQHFEFVTGTAAIEGYVTHNGEFVNSRRAKVSLSVISDAGMTKAASPVEETGFYRIAGLAAGAYEVEAEFPDARTNRWVHQSAQVEIPEGETTRLDIEISQGSASGE